MLAFNLMPTAPDDKKEITADPFFEAFGWNVNVQSFVTISNYFNFKTSSSDFYSVEVFFKKIF